MMHFGLDLYQQLVAAAPNDNLIYSPTSVASALAMAALGGQGETSSEMTRALHEDGDLHALAKVYGERSRAWTSTRPGMTLKTANRLYADRAFSVRESYQTTLRGHFGAPLEALDFAHDQEGSRKVINDWVAAQTETRIQNLMPPGSIVASTRMVLVNAVYFKGKWSTPFEPSDSKVLPFHAPRGDVKVTMMRSKGSLRSVHLPKEGYRAIELPYAGDEVAMLVFLPEPNVKLRDVEAKLDQATVHTTLQALTSSSLDLQFPRFKLAPESSTSLLAMLRKLGINKAFSATDADFSGISESGEKIFISDVVHKAFIQVDEEGTEAAAATGASFYAVSVPVFTPVVVDRPFAFMIVDRKSEVPYFIGRVLTPAEK
jgi:serpin B